LPYSLSHLINRSCASTARLGTSIDASLKPLMQTICRRCRGPRPGGLQRRAARRELRGGVVPMSTDRKPAVVGSLGPSLAPVLPHRLCCEDRSAIVSCATPAARASTSASCAAAISSSRARPAGRALLGHLTGLSSVDVRSIARRRLDRVGRPRAFCASAPRAPAPIPTRLLRARRYPSNGHRRGARACYVHSRGAFPRRRDGVDTAAAELALGSLATRSESLPRGRPRVLLVPRAHDRSDPQLTVQRGRRLRVTRARGRRRAAGLTILRSQRLGLPRC